MPITNKADNTTVLNNAGSWTAGVPNSTTVARWNLVTQRNTTIGGNVTMGCIANTGSALAVINNTSGATLTISGSVTDVPGYEGYGIYLTNGSLTIGTYLSIVNDQYWYVASGRYVDKLTTGWGGTGKVTLDAISGWYSYTTSTHTGTWQVERGIMVAAASVTAPFGQAANTITLTGTLGDVGLGCRTTASVAMLNNLNLSAASLYLYNVDNGAGYLQLTGTVNITTPSTPTFVVGNLIYMDGAITCANGLTITNSGSYFSARNSNIYLRGVNSGFYGPITVNNTSASFETSVRLGTDLATNFPNVTSINLQTEGSGVWVRNQNLASSTSTDAVFTGLGWVWPGGTSSSAVVCTFNNENALSGLTGSLVPTNGGASRNGLLLYTDSTTLFCVSNLKDFPTVVQYYQANTSAASGQTLRYISEKLTHSYASTKIYINNSTASAAIGAMELYANQGTGALVLGDGTTNTGIHKIGLMTGQMTFTLRGSNSEDNTIAGVIQQTSGTLAITKTDGGKWVLSGANTYTGNTTLSGGELVLKNSNAIQNSTLVHQTAGTTLTLDPSLTAATFGGLSGAGGGVSLTIPSGLNLSIGNNNTATSYSNTLLGPGTLTKIGTSSFYLYGNQSGFNSTISLSNGILGVSCSQFGAMTISHPTVGNRTSKLLVIEPSVTNGYIFPAGFQLTGDGVIFFTSVGVTSLTTGFTLPSGATSGLTGTTAGSSTGAVAGLALYGEASANTSYRNTILNLNDLPGGGSPGVLTYEFNCQLTNIAVNQNVYYVSSSGTHNYQTRIDIINYAGTVAFGTGTQTANLYANQGTGALVLSGGINRYATTPVSGPAYTTTLNLRGTSTANNEISGNITQTSGILAITKNDAGKWIISGSGNHTGNTTISGGELVIKNTNAVQNSTVVWQTAGTTLTLDSSIANFTFGGLSGTAAGLTLTIPSGDTLTVGGNNSTTTFANAISGPGNFTKVGTGQLTLSGSLSGFASTLTASAGMVYLTGSSFGAMTIDHTTVGVRASKWVAIYPTSTNGYSFPAGFQLTGLGSVFISSGNISSLTTGITLPAGSLTNLTGTSAGASTGSVAGLISQVLASNTTFRTSTVNINEFPGGASGGVFCYEYSYDLTNIALTNSLYYINSGATHNYPARIDVINHAGTTAIGTGSQTANLYANQSTGPLVLSGGIVRHSTVSTYDVNLILRGTNTEDNEISGAITQSSGVLSISKSDAGTWKLTGSNTFTGSLTVNAGNLYISNANSYGALSLTGGSLFLSGSNTAAGAASGNTTISAAGTMNISGGITINKGAGTLAITGNASLGTPSIVVASGANTWSSSGNVTLATNGVFIDVATSSSLDFSSASAIWSGTGISLGKSGGGTLTLRSTVSTYTGSTQVTAGTLEIAKLSAGGSASSIGSGTTSTGILAGPLTLSSTSDNVTIKHIGTTSDTYNRLLTFRSATGSALTLDSSGIGGLVNFNHSAGTRFPDVLGSGTHTVILTGSNTGGTNIIGGAIPDTSHASGGATSIVKNGTNGWTVGSITASGTITCNVGTLTISGAADSITSITNSATMSLVGSSSAIQNITNNSGSLNLNATNRSLSGTLTVISGTVSVNSGTTISANVAMDGGTIVGKLVGASKTLSVSNLSLEASPATISQNDSTTGSNTFTGNVTIDGGCVDLVTPSSLDVRGSGKGMVLGQSNTVTVNTNGVIRTKAGSSTSQNGTARYNRLVFNAGSKLKIGFAA